MTDRRVRAALDEMEGWLEDPAWEADPEQVAAWNQAYAEALESAERDEGWELLAQRAHALGARLEARVAALSRERDALKLELDGQSLGSRALRAYRPAQG